MVQPIFVNANNVIIDGESRVRAAELRGIKKLHCKICKEDLTEDELICLRMWLNPSARIPKDFWNEKGKDIYPFKRVKKEDISNSRRAIRILARQRRELVSAIKEQLSYDYSLVEIANWLINCIRGLDGILRRVRNQKPPQNLVKSRLLIQEAIKTMLKPGQK